MNKIKFSHGTYLKFKSDCNRSNFSAVLMEVLKVNYANLSEEFIKYDTRYIVSGKVKFYSLPKTDLLLLLFFERNGFRCFPTLRRWSEEKENNYRSKIGKVFEIDIVNKSGAFDI